jgi:hypothetical protein
LLGVFYAFSVLAADWTVERTVFKFGAVRFVGNEASLETKDEGGRRRGGGG